MPSLKCFIHSQGGYVGLGSDIRFYNGFRWNVRVTGQKFWCWILFLGQWLEKLFFLRWRTWSGFIWGTLWKVPVELKPLSWCGCIWTEKELRGGDKERETLMLVRVITLSIITSFKCSFILSQSQAFKEISCMTLFTRVSLSYTSMWNDLYNFVNTPKRFKPDAPEHGDNTFYLKKRWVLNCLYFYLTTDQLLGCDKLSNTTIKTKQTKSTEVTLKILTLIGWLVW